MNEPNPMSFEFNTAPRIIFGAGAAAGLRDLVLGLGTRSLLVIGGESAEASGLRQRLQGLFPVGAVVRCAHEPELEDVERAVAAGKEGACDLVVAIGGGSVLDCGKAAAAMSTNPGSLRDYLEGVGEGRSVKESPLPLVAVPTTAGTGSEVTRNAVISGPGFKRSIRSLHLIPRVALVDPELTLTLPPAVTAASGLDALTQLIESTLSRRSTPLVDGLALQGIRHAGRFLERAFRDGADGEARRGMSLASLLGGICLANAGLGAVHGLAAPLGARCAVPHGVACATLLPGVLRANLLASEGTPEEERVAARCQHVFEALTGERFADRRAAVDAGLARLEALQRGLGIPRLGELGVTPERIDDLVRDSRGSSMRTNPVELTDEVLGRLLRQTL